VRRYAAPIGIAALIALVWLIAGRESGQSLAQPCVPEAGASPSAGAPPAVVALLGDEIEDSGEFEGPHVQRLLRISLPDGEVQAERRVGRRLPNRSIDRDDSYRLNVARAPLLAATPNGKAVIVLVREPAAGRDSLVVVDTATLETRCTHPLEKGVRYSGLVLGRSGRAYASGAKRVGAPGRWDAVLTITDAETGAVAGSHTLRKAERGYRRDAGRDWYPYGGALSPDERRIAVSYHGNDTTGADLFTVSRDADVLGSPRTPVGIDIELAHGAVAALRTGFVATAGELGLLQLDRDGRVVRRVPIAPKSHLMDLAVDTSRSSSTSARAVSVR